MYNYYDYYSPVSTEGLFEEMGVMSFIIIIISLIMLLWITFKMIDIAVDKGYEYCTVRIFVLCFFFNIIGYLYVLALPDLKLQKQNERIIDLLSNIAKAQNTGITANQTDNPIEGEKQY